MNHAAAASTELPQTVTMLGRTHNEENGDICGLYHLAGIRGGYPDYLNRSTGVAIRYWAPLARWVIDRGGIRDSDVCVAYATGSAQHVHPGDPELTWHVWEADGRGHLPDRKLIALDAPNCITFIGRDPARENSSAIGKYVLAGEIHGRAAYRHETEDLVLRYHLPEHRWLISPADSIDGNMCSVWADAGNSKHPLDVGAYWHFWEGLQNEFVVEQNAGFVVAPGVVHVLGRDPNLENARINGAYQLYGICEGKPVYVQPGTQYVMRYSAKNDRWLIDCDGRPEPSLPSRLWQWVLTGDGKSAYETCSAWANACGTTHPGNMDLQWRVFDKVSQEFKVDPHIMATSSPQALEVNGRDARDSNSDIIGDYQFAGAYRGCPVYQKPGTQITIYYSKHSRWVVDRHGNRDAGVCVAYISDLFAAEPQDPAAQKPQWHIWHSSQQKFVVDPSMSAVPLLHTVPDHFALSVPGALPTADASQRGVKRAQGFEHDVACPLSTPLPKTSRMFPPSATFPGGVSSWPHSFGA